MKIKKIILLALIPIVLIGVYLLYTLFSSNTNFNEKQEFIYIKTGSSYEQVLEIIKNENVLNNFSSFESMASKMNLKNNIHPGKYKIENGMGNYSIVKMLRSGQQTPIKLVINKLRTKNDIITKISSQLEADSNELRKLFNDNTFLKLYGIDSNQIQALIIPATYEFYWNTNAKKAIEKLGKSYTSFWNDERKVKARAINLSPAEVSTLAAIVQEETNKKDDAFKIASTYLNRLKIGMPLQADPTCKFAVNDFTLRRILTVHTLFNSPYNTYKNRGLPPGPICTPAQHYIDAVLDAPKTSYLYFCAKEDFSGYTNFASTLEEHNANAKKYQEALNQRGIKK